MRYFLEVAYKGTNYSGFQLQANANTIQAEVEKAIQICCRQHYKLTGSSRTDAGVHAYQNFFHVDVETEWKEHLIYNLNSVLPFDIGIKSITPVAENAHCRFDAISRRYKYFIYTSKNPFLVDSAWFYPYKLNIEALLQAGEIILNYTDFTSFSKLHTNTKTNNCEIFYSNWNLEGTNLIYEVKANRFLRGMVKGMIGTMLQVARGALSIEQFKKIIQEKDCRKANFTTPARGLFLAEVEYHKNLFNT